MGRTPVQCRVLDRLRERGGNDTGFHGNRGVSHPHDYITPPTLLSFSKMDRIKRRRVRQVTPVMEADIMALLSVGMDKKVVASVFNVSLRTVYKIQEKDDGN